MSITVLKIFALIFMLLDHIGVSFGSTGWMILPSSLETIFRTLGRITFPIFAFSLVNGWLHTKDKRAYAERMLLFAFLSQIPYTLAFYPGNLLIDNKQTIPPYDGYWGFDYIIIYIFTMILLFILSHYYLDKSKRFLVLVAVALIPALFTLKIKYIWINGDNLNIFYTLSISIFFIFCYEKIKNKLIINKMFYFIMPFTCIILSLFIGIRADYGNYLLGLILIIMLYALRKHRWQQIACIAIWGILLYGIILNNWQNAIAASLAAILIKQYNGKKGLDIKKLFYYFYPIHLLIIGFINMLIKFKII